MTRLKSKFALWVGIVFFGCATGGSSTPEKASYSQLTLNPDAVVTQLGFGSCAHQDKPQPIWPAILEAQPDLFILMGDNIYGDTEDMDLLRAKYRKAASIEGFRALRERVPVLATWDDHDYGFDDSGAEFPKKKESREAFLDFIGEPANSSRRAHEGIYDAQVFGPPGKRLQIILLDMRYFRDPLKKKAVRAKGEGPYEQSDDPSLTLLGEEQWKWLEAQLRVPAELRILVSSIQVVAQSHAWEKWGNFPHERKRLFDLIDQTGAEGVVILSGDRHRSSLARQVKDVPYPIYDFTVSALANPLPTFLLGPEPDPLRIGPLYDDSNFGWMGIDWKAKRIELEIRDVAGKTAYSHSISFNELKRELSSIQRGPAINGK